MVDGGKWEHQSRRLPLAQGDELIAIELVIISDKDEGIFLRFKHFGADYEAWEKDEPNTYLLQSVESGMATFANIAPREGIPNAMVYRKSGDSLEFRGTDDLDSPPDDSDLILLFHRVSE